MLHLMQITRIAVQSRTTYLAVQNQTARMKVSIRTDCKSILRKTRVLPFTFPRSVTIRVRSDDQFLFSVLGQQKVDML